MVLLAVEVPVALFEIGAILLGTGILARLSQRIGLPSIPLFLLIGLLLGRGGLVPVGTATEFIEIGAEIGVVVLLLLLGLEYTGEELRQSLRQNVRGGLADALLNFTPGFLSGLVLGFPPLTASFLGGVTYISSSGIIAKLLGDLGRMGNRETPTVLSILVIEDLAMALYLPIVTGLAMSDSVGSTVTTVVVSVFAVALVLAVVTRHGSRLTTIALGKSEDPEVILLMVLGLALFVAAIGESVNISAAVAAFLVGIAISGDVATRARAVLAPIRDLFAAIFFVFFGLEVDPAELWPVLGTALLLAIVTGLTKYVTGWYSARSQGVGAKGRRRAGAALIARGEFSIVIAQLAIGAGLDSRIGPLATTYVLLLAVVGPVLTRFADRPARAAA